MKRALLNPIIFVALIVVSCVSDTPVDPVNFLDDANNQQESTTRTIEEVVDIVKSNYGSIFDVKLSRSDIYITKENVSVIRVNNGARSLSTDTVLYVVNFGEESGFAVVSANKQCTPLLAMTDNGHIDEIADIDNPGLKSFFDAAIAYNSFNNTIIEPVLPPQKRFLYHRIDSTIVDKKPKATMLWGQNWPEGYFCPNGYSGCVSTALAISLSYFGIPHYIDLTYPNRDIDKQILDWTKIKNNVRSQVIEPSEKVNESEHMALARFCREIGHRIDADYSYPDKTGAQVSDLRDMIANLAPAIDVSEYHNAAPNVEYLSNWSIIVMSGYDPEDPLNAHTFIIDGYKSKTVLHRYYNLPSPIVAIDLDSYLDSNNIMPEEKSLNVYYKLSHINWGLNGHNNGYYDVGVYDLSQYKELDIPNLYPMDADYQYAYEYFTLNR